MKKVIVLLIFLSVSLLATSTTIVKSGWQMVGFDTDIEDMSLFKSESVEQVWIYSTATEKWSGYSPNSETMAKISASYGTISKINRWQGVWIKSSKEWYLNQEAQNNSDNPIDTIELKKGWNLISIPIDSTLSPKIFDDNQTLIWKYNSEDWQLFDHNTTGFSPIEKIQKGDGVWIKVENDRTIELSKESAKLQTFASKEEMRAYIETLTKVNHTLYYYDISPMDDMMIETTADTAASMSNATASNSSSDIKEASDTTSTNLQESGVDESNTIKSDSRYVYYLNRNSNTIEVRSYTQLVDNSKELVATIELEGTYKYIDSFYLYQNKLVVISNLYEERNQVVVDIYDLNNITAINKQESFTMDAYLNSTRIVDNRLLVVSSFAPYVTLEYPKIYIEDASECQVYYNDEPTTATSSTVSTDMINSESVAVSDNYYYPYHCYSIYFDSDGKAYRYDYDKPTISNQYLIPQLSYSNYSGDLIDYSSFYAPLKQNQTPNITTLTAFDLDKLEFVKSVSIVGNSSIVYASTTSLYTISEEYPIFFSYQDYQERSVIYKFGIDDELSFEAMGFINGRALNQFSLSEYNKTLRVATTEGFSWGGDTQNSIFTLQQQGMDLETVGYLGSLGKEGESIQSVRFMGTKGFVVTFRQTDPLYTLDLSNPIKPSKVGELQVNGFSQYMHLVDSERLLTIGRDATSDGQQLGILIELFDISDFANPKLASKLTLGDSSYTSEALINHKAFIYRESDKLFGFDYYSWNNYYSNNFGLYQVDGFDLKEIEKLSISNYNFNYNPRAVVFDYDNVTYVSYLHNDSFQTKVLTNQ